MASIRHALEPLDPATSDHPYLALERLIPDCAAKEGARQQHQQKAVQRNLPGKLKVAYQRAFSHRYQALQGYAGGIEGGVTRFFSLKVSGRLVAGLGNASVLESGISLNHTYGLPYLPGTGLKGLASTAAHLGLTGATWRRGKEEQGHWTGQGEDHQVLFGTMDTSAEDAAAGIVIFHDAWWDPEPDTGKPEIGLPFQLDVMTPHHQAYNLEGEDWPNDWENPIPIPFLTTGGSFRLALTGPPEWVDAAKEILLMAFRHLGFGAKTQIGYGRRVLAEAEEEAERIARESRQREAAERMDAERIAQEKYEREEADRHKAAVRAQRDAMRQSSEGKLIPTDPGRGLYQLVFGTFTLSSQSREELKGLSNDWVTIAAEAKKRGERGARVRVDFCIENGQPVLLMLAPNVPTP